MENHSARFELRAGDNWSGDVPGEKNRSELRHDANLPFETDLWLSYGMRVTGTLPADWFILGQFHDEHDVGESYKYPPLAMEYDNGTFTIATRSDTAAMSAVEDPGGVIRFSEPGIPLGVWQQFVIRFRFSRTGDGYLRVWRDGVQIVPGGVIPMGYNDVLGHYWKFGAYRHADPGVVIVDYSHMEIGTADLSSRILSPPPIPDVFG